MGKRGRLSEDVASRLERVLAGGRLRAGPPNAKETRALRELYSHGWLTQRGTLTVHGKMREAGVLFEAGLFLTKYEFSRMCPTMKADALVWADAVLEERHDAAAEILRNERWLEVVLTKTKPELNWTMQYGGRSRAAQVLIEEWRQRHRRGIAWRRA